MNTMYSTFVDAITTRRNANFRVAERIGAVVFITALTAMATRIFVHTSGDPHALVPSVRRVIREISADQPVARPATLDDVRAQVLSPERVNAFVMTGFAGIALLIAVVGVSGVLAFSVSARTREFGVRLAIGSTPRNLLMRVLSEGTVTVVIGIAAGAIGGYVFAKLGMPSPIAKAHGTIRLR